MRKRGLPSVQALQRLTRAAVAANPNLALGTAVFEAGQLMVQFAGGDSDGELRITDPPVVLVNARRHKRRGRIQDGQAVVVGFQNRDRESAFVLANAPVVRGIEEVVRVNVSLTGALQWPVLGRDLAATFDTGDRSDPGWELPDPAADPPYWERQQQWSHFTSPRVAKNRIIWLQPNGDYAWRILHPRLGKTEDEERKDDPTYLDEVNGNLDEWTIDLDDAPAWCTPSEVSPSRIVLEEVNGGDGSDGNPVVNAYVTFFNANVV